MGPRRRGRKRHLLVDAGGLRPPVLLHPAHLANLADRDGARAALTAALARHPALTRGWVDAGSAGALLPWAKPALDLAGTIAQRPRRGVWTPADQEPAPPPAGVPVVPRRGVAERAFAGLGRQRRPSKDHQALPTPEEAWIPLAPIGVMARRLAA